MQIEHYHTRFFFLALGLGVLGVAIRFPWMMLYFHDSSYEPLLYNISIVSYSIILIICFFVFLQFKKSNNDFWWVNPWLAYLLASLTRLLTTLWLEDSIGMMVRFAGGLLYQLLFTLGKFYPNQLFYFLGKLYPKFKQTGQEKGYPQPNWDNSDFSWGAAFFWGGRVTIV